MKSRDEIRQTWQLRRLTKGLRLIKFSNDKRKGRSSCQRNEARFEKGEDEIKLDEGY